MSASPIEVPVNPLPRDLDVTVTINRPQTELQSDLSLMCFVTPDAPFPPNNSRVRVYSSQEALLQDTGWTPANTGYWASKAFFDQPVRPPRMAVGRVFEETVPAQLMAAVITDYDSLRAITTGSFAVDITDDSGVSAVVAVAGINFSSITNLQSIAAAINTAITKDGQSALIGAEVAYDGRLVISDKTAGTAISFAAPSGSGTDVSALLCLTQAEGAQKWDSYAPTGLMGEVRYIASAARVGSFPVYAWALDRKYRDTPEQRQVSDWAESQNWKAWALQCTNKPTAYDSGDTTNICFYAYNLAYRATSVQFSANPQYYPEVAYATSVLGVNYSLKDSVVNACHKDATGIPPENITETQLAVLAARNCNVFVLVGNTARTQRYGTQSAPTWWTDSYAGACNFREAIQVNVANCLYRNRRIPYTTRGQAMILSAIAKACNDFVYNGYLADRDVLDEQNENGYSTIKAYILDPTPIYRATETQRAKRILPPVRVTAYEAGAINHVDVYVDLLN